MSATAPHGAPVLRRPALRLRLDRAHLTRLVNAPFWPGLGVAGVAGLLRLVSLAGTRTNPYYDAAVRSMSLSLHNFLYGVFTPGGQLAIDKPPVDLWFQVASVKLFGFTPQALILPEAIAASLACWLLYDLVRRAFGTAAGVAAGLALAVLPISVITSRSDTMDSLMMALMVLAAWLVVRAAQTGHARWLYLAMAVMGLDFEVKLFEALVVLPALYLLYWIAMPETRRRRLEQLGLGTIVFVAVGLSWLVFVSITPVSKRPFPIGSTNGSVWNSTFVYNGTSRLSPPKAQKLVALKPSHHHRLQPLHKYHHKKTSASPSGFKRFLENRGGDYGMRVGLELVAAIGFAALAAAAAILRRGPPPPRRQIGLAVAVAAWLIPGFVVLTSVNQLHERYLESISAAIAAALGIGIVSLVRLASVRLAGLACLAAALFASVVFAFQRANLGGTAVLIVVAALLAIAAAAAARLTRVAIPIACALATAAVLAAPFNASLAVVRHHTTDSGFPGSLPSRTSHLLSRYLRKHQGHARYELAASSWSSASQIIVNDARPVLALTSVYRKPLVSVKALRADVRHDKVRYVLITGDCGTTPVSHLPRCPAAVSWARLHAVDVTRKAGVHQKGLLWRFTAHASARRRTATPLHRRRHARRHRHRAH